MIALTSWASAFVLTQGEVTRLSLDAREDPVVLTAVSILQGDLKSVMNIPLQVSSQDPQIIVGTYGGAGTELLDASGFNFTGLDEIYQGFILAVNTKGQLVIAGSDSQGTAYGLIEVTRRMGVSPWEWWADVTPDKLEQFSLPEGVITQQHPNVAYRGIFINDEDFGLLPWASTNFEVNDQHAIGPKTTRKVFELLMRLKANLYWPPMHECTQPFFLTPGNRELAERFGIHIGTSHCEPLACNAASEWALRGKGDYNYATNKDEVQSFWMQRIKETSLQPMVYTLGMRGVHDGAMQGAATPVERRNLLQQIISDQRDMLGARVSEHIETIPQVFIPYKEVQDAYDAGLQVPDDVTLMWCDDNYGYIRHFPTPAEQERSGGNGIYYHASYWGKPHDYLWLGTANPFLMYQQLSEAYYHGAHRMWVLNVGDIKPAEYQISLFMDMAWDLDSIRRVTVATHLEEFYAQVIGRDVARLISIYMKDHFNLSFQRKPEHLAGTRVYEPAEIQGMWEQIHEMPWTEKQIRARLTRYDDLERHVKWVSDSVHRIHRDREDAFFQLVEYPILATAAQNKKYLLAQLARHGVAWLQGENVQDTWDRSDQAHETIQQLTHRYDLLCGGKWRGIMNASPRSLPVFKPITHTKSKEPLLPDVPTIATYYGASYNSSSFSGWDVLGPVLGLGASIRAMPIPKGCNLTYKFKHNFQKAKYVEVEIHMLPTHPIEALQRMTVSFDGDTPHTCTWDAKVDSEEWKQNVTRNYAVLNLHIPVSQAAGEHTLVLSALDDGVVVDEIIVKK